jgi:osmotically-inducible protein OsmY
VEAHEIKHEIERSFKRQAEIDAANITVEVSGGDVVLRGTVRSVAERKEAERVAWSAPGVKSVKSQITVNPTE